MIRIDIKRSQNGNMVGFLVSGHAGFAEYGSDIVCASVSVLVINCINSIETYSNTAFVATEDERTGIIEFTCEGEMDEAATLLLNSLVLGLRGIQEEYGNEYVTLHQ